MIGINCPCGAEINVEPEYNGLVRCIRCRRTHRIFLSANKRKPFADEIGAPSPAPEGGIISRSDWESSAVPGQRKKCVLILSETKKRDKTTWWIHYYQAPAEGRHPTLQRKQRFDVEEDAIAEFAHLKNESSR